MKEQSTEQLLRRLKGLLEEHRELVEDFHNLKREIRKHKQSQNLKLELLEGERVFKRGDRPP